jgi:ribosome recycling factor
MSIEDSIVSLKGGLKKLRTGRANIAVLDGIVVEYYGANTPLSQCAQLSAPEPRLLTVKPWDKGMVGPIEKALMNSGLGITPQSDGEVIRLPIPQLTEERRKDLVKQAKGRGEEAKIAIRNHRRTINDMLKEAEKEKEMSQDDLKRAIEKVQEVTNAGVSQVDNVLAQKESEILEI